MKQFLLFLSLFGFAHLSAQITINSDDIKPLGVVASQAEDSDPDPSIEPGTTGQQDWDFSALANDGALEFTFIDPDSTPYASLYPNNNLASVQGNNYFYFNQTATELTASGTFGDFDYQGLLVTAEVRINPPQTFLKFPATEGDSFTENLEQFTQVEASAVGLGALYDSVRIVRTLSRTVTIDAYGNITTPLGTFESIRSTEVEIISDELTGKSISSGMWTVIQPLPSSEQTLYNWWTKDGNVGFPIVQVQTDETGSVTGANWVTDFVSNSEEAFDLEFSLYPNPAPHSFFVEFPEFFNGNIEVRNLNGQLIFQEKINSQKEYFATDKMPNGSYLLIVKNDTGKMVAAKRFEVIR